MLLLKVMRSQQFIILSIGAQGLLRDEMQNINSVHISPPIPVRQIPWCADRYDGGALSLREAGSMIAEGVVGTGSLLTDYTYKTDIDAQTYNSIKLSRPNEETGRADVFQAIDSGISPPVPVRQIPWCANRSERCDTPAPAVPAGAG